MRSRFSLLLWLWAFLLASTSASALVKHWGGYGGTTAVLTPSPVKQLNNVTALDAGNASAYALESNGTVWAWGEDTHGQLGNGATGDGVTATAVQVKFPSGTVIRAIGEAQAEGAAVDKTGQGWGWGYNGLGSLCVRHPDSTDITIPVKTAVTNAVAVQGGELHTLWLLSNGTVEACGANHHGQLGNGGTKSSTTPVHVVGLEHVVEISAGQLDSCARTESGEVFTWGGNEHGQLGDGSTKNSDVPVHIVLPGPASLISCGGSQPNNGHSFAIVKGEVIGWGADEFGQLGDGGGTDKLSPVATGLHFARVVASGQSSIGLDAEGNVWTWGEGSRGDLGTGNEKTQLVPQLVDTGATMISGTSADAADG
jgi:alpha-tubulin suppressor-like RCC1 family protein